MSINEVEEFSKGGEPAVTLSSSEVLDKEKDLCNQIVGLRRQMERLEKLVTQLGSGGPVVQELKCQVCGFLLKAHKATIQINNLSESHIHVMGNLAMRGTSLGKPSVQLNSLECGPFLKQIELGSGLLGSLGNVGVALMENQAALLLAVEVLELGGSNAAADLVQAIASGALPVGDTSLSPSLEGDGVTWSLRVRG